MYLYDTRRKSSTLPIDGWLFPCYMCREIISNNIKFIYKKYYFLKNIELTIPLCKNCILNSNPLILKDRIIKIE